MGKKSKFSKKSKKSWRITDIKDVEAFYEDKLLEERLGGPFSAKTDEELFIVEKEGKDDMVIKSKQQKLCTSRKAKKKRALEPPRCFKILENLSKVQDPIRIRNRVKTKEERKSRIQKEIEEKLRKRGIMKRKEVIAANNRTLNKKRANKKLKMERNPLKFDKDLWDVDENFNTGDEVEQEVEANEWLDKDTLRHYKTNTGKLKVRAPKSINIKPSALPSIEEPHPGISYNPSKQDHNQLLQAVAEKEIKMDRYEKYLERVTTGKFLKVTREEAENNWFKEMSQGLKNIKSDADNDNEMELENSDSEYKTVNPPALCKRKPLKKKKMTKVIRQEELKKRKMNVEKKKIADIYKLRFMEREIQQKEEEGLYRQEKKKKSKLQQKVKTKVLGRTRFSEPLPEFQRPHELRKNLRTFKQEGNILADRFYSLQKRNIIEPRTCLRQKKAKVKRFFKPGQKMDDIEAMERKVYSETVKNQ